MPKSIARFDDQTPLVFSHPISYDNENPTLSLSPGISKGPADWTIKHDSDTYGLILTAYDGTIEIRVLWTVQPNGYMDGVVIYQPDNKPMDVDHHRSIAWGAAPFQINKSVAKFMLRAESPNAEDRALLNVRWSGVGALQQAETKRRKMQNPDDYEVCPILVKVGDKRLRAGYGIFSLESLVGPST